MDIFLADDVVNTGISSVESASSGSSRDMVSCSREGLVRLRFTINLLQRSFPLLPDIRTMPASSMCQQRCKSCELQAVAENISDGEINSTIFVICIFVEEKVWCEDLAD